MTTNEARPVDSMTFEVEDPEYVRAGVDFRDGTRLYETAVTGTVHLYVDGVEVVREARFPSSFDISDSVTSIHRGISEFKSRSESRFVPFCCACGVRSCSFVEWELRRAGSTTELVMEELLGDPLGDHVYSVALPTVCEPVVELADIVVGALEAAGASGTTAGAVEEFEQLRADLDRWANE